MSIHAPGLRGIYASMRQLEIGTIIPLNVSLNMIGSFGIQVCDVIDVRTEPEIL